MDNKRKEACFIISAAKGDRAAARGLVGRAIRSAAQAAPSPRYCKQSIEHGHTMQGRWLAMLTEVEFAAVCELVEVLSEKEGWDVAPFDAYQD